MSNRLPFAKPHPLGHVPDAELLRRFVESRDESAFELLVWRYQRLVLAVARRVLHNAADAEDATQAAFLVLARRADAVRGNLTGWLYRVAYRCASRIKHRRPEPLPLYVEPRIDADVSIEWEETALLLDEELNRLPGKYREPLVLCFLQGKTYPEAAAQLGCPVGTLSGWITRGKELLHARLTRRGVTLALPAFATYLSNLAAEAGDPGRWVSGLTQSALAFAAGDPSPGRATTIAQGIMTMMALKKTLAAVAAGLLLAVGVLGLAAFADDDPPKEKDRPAAAKAKPVKTDKDRLQGEWVFEVALMPGGANAVPWVWQSRIVFDGDSVKLTNYTLPYTDTTVPELKSTFKLDAAKGPKEIDIAVPALAPMIFGAEFKGATIRGIYKLDGDDTLTMCLADRPVFPRPTVFDVKDTRERFVYTLRRAAKPGEELPKQVRVKVVDEDGKGVAGAKVTNFGHYFTADGESKWHYTPGYTTDADGTFLVETTDLRDGTFSLRVADRNLYAIASASPYRVLTDRPLTVIARPGCKIAGTLTSKKLAEKKVPLGWTNVYLELPNLRGLPMGYQSEEGRFELTAPPGTYNLHAYGSYLESKRHEVTVKPGDTEMAVSIDLEPNEIGKILGEPAAELKDVKGWKGDAVTLADLKGKAVLLHFWLYDKHGPQYSRDEIADLHAVHDQYKDRGLEVILVAVDREGKVSTADEFSAKVKKVRGADDKLVFPFRVALMHGDPKFADRNGLVVGNATMSDYGVSLPSFPVLIDRAGKVDGLNYSQGNPNDKKRLEAILNTK